MPAHTPALGSNGSKREKGEKHKGRIEHTANGNGNGKPAHQIWFERRKRKSEREKKNEAKWNAGAGWLGLAGWLADCRAVSLCLWKYLWFYFLCGLSIIFATEMEWYGLSQIVVHILFSMVFRTQETPRWLLACLWIPLLLFPHLFLILGSFAFSFSLCIWSWSGLASSRLASPVFAKNLLNQCGDIRLIEHNGIKFTSKSGKCSQTKSNLLYI